jgi:hypothetical protein
MRPIQRIKPAYSGEILNKSPYGKYKEDLIKDFHGYCGYCSTPDFVWGGKAGFQIDHFAPQKQFPEHEESYQNLIYSCPICNRGKSNFWPSKLYNVNVVDNEGFIHPCSEQYGLHLFRHEYGNIGCKSKLGMYMYKRFKLGLQRHRIIWLLEELAEVINQVKVHMDNSSALKSKYYELCSEYFEYNEVLKNIINKR